MGTSQRKLSWSPWKNKMDVIIGLGSAGCNIADQFAKHKQYKIYKIDENLKGLQKNGIYNMPWQCSAERYESDCPSLKKFFKDCKGEALFVVGGSGNISACTLAVLENLKKCKINVMYIRPDVELIPETKKRQEWLVFNVLQEYARSAAIQRLWLVDNTSVEKIIGDVPVVGYFDRLNELIVSTFHMINVYNHNEALVSTFSEPFETHRLSTVGISDTKTGGNKMFFPLYKVKDLRYYYAINKDRLEKDGKLFTNIKEQIKGSMTEETKISYSVYSTDYEDDYVYVCANTPVIQRYKTNTEVLKNYLLDK